MPTRIPSIPARIIAACLLIAAPLTGPNAQAVPPPPEAPQPLEVPPETPPEPPPEAPPEPVPEAAAPATSSPPLPPATTEALLGRLGDPDFATREAVTAQLLADTALTMPQIGQLIAQATGPEQQHRLLAIARHHLLRQIQQTEFNDGTQGALGVSQQPLDAPAGQTHGAVRVVATLPGFPGHTHLRPGDRILALNGQPFPPTMTPGLFPGLIQNYQAGQTLTLTIERLGQTFDRPITLATKNALSAMYPDGLAVPYHQRWLQTRQQLVAPHTP